MSGSGPDLRGTGGAPRDDAAPAGGAALPALDARSVPVIALDGPTASGKGTIAQRVAAALGWHYLDSGALYRLTALSAIDHDLRFDDAPRLAELAAALPAGFTADARILLAGEDVTDAIRGEAVGNGASRLAVHPEVRDALLALQRGFRRPPGLVADGRDMGTVVFPDAELKVFLTASAESRAGRRHKQLIEKGISASLLTLLQELRERDARDTSRPVAPLVPAQDAHVLDSTALTVDETVARVLDLWSARR
jgi:cytidylate kinase